MKSSARILAALVLSSALSTPALAQVATIATANPIIAIARAKAFQAANQQIETTYKSSFDQIDQKMTQRQSVLSLLDKNKDKQVDDNELKAAKLAKNPALKQLDTLEADIQKLQVPALTAQLFALESLMQRYDAAQTKVITDKRVGVLVRPDAVIYQSPTADITDAITAELDRSAPSVSTTAPANWQPRQATVSLLQQINQLSQIAAMRRAQGGAAPTTPQQPQGR
jgi:Skp family chaperone for outer membrane proteins